MTDIVDVVLAVDSRQVKDGTKALNELGTESKSTSSATEQMSKSYASMAAQVVGATAVLAGTIAAIKSSVKAADDYNKALTGLASVARYAGQDVSGTLNTALSLTEDGLLSTTESATALKNLLAKGFSTDEAVQMINRLKDAAAFGRQSTLGLAEAVVGATEGIKNENSMMIDNAGVTKNAAVMIEEYAKSLGKSSKELSEAEKRAALFSGIMRETEGQIGNAALASDGLTGKQSALSKAVNDTAVSIGQAFMPAAVALVDVLGKSMGWLNDSVIKPVIFTMQNLGITIGEIVMKATALFNLLASPGELLKNPQEAIKKYQEEIKTLGDVADKMRMDAATALNTVATPEIGADTGARRKDVAQIEDAKEAQRAEDKAKKLEERQALETQRLIEAQNDRYQRLEEAALDADATVEEREAMKRDREMVALAEKYDAIQQNHVMTLEEEQNFQNAMLNIQKASDAQKSAQGKAAFIQDLATLGKQNNAFLMLYKLAATMEILMAGGVRAEKSAAWAATWGGPIAAAAAFAVSWAATMANVGMVTGLIGGGGGGGAGSGAGAGAGAGGGTPTYPFQPEPVQVAEAKPMRELRVTVESDGPHSQGMREFAKNLAETIRDMGGTDNLVIS
jgi:tetratricopeptide (TPR) repeat protein